MSEYYLKTTNYSFFTENACDKEIERLESANASFEAMAFSDAVEFEGEQIPVPPTLIAEGGAKVKPSEIKSTSEFKSIVAGFRNDGKAFDSDVKSDSPVIEYGKKPYYPFDFNRVETLVNKWGLLPEAPQMIRNQMFFYIRRVLLLKEINDGKDRLKNG